MKKPELSIVINTYERLDLLIPLLKSIYRCSMPVSYEVIVIDDHSKVLYEKKLHTLYPSVIFERTPHQYFLIKARNKGWKLAKGNIVFFIDDDNEIKDKNFFVKALKELALRPDVGILGCRTYYFDEPDYIMVGPNRFNKFTGRVKFLGQNGQDTKELEGCIETNDNPNAFFTYNALLKKSGGFSPEIVQTMSEADFSEKIRSLNKRVVQYSELKVYHKSPRIDYAALSIRQMGGSPRRLYYLLRNRFVYIKKWGSLSERLVFTALFSHIYLIYYLSHIIRLREFGYIQSAILGTFDGYLFMITGLLRNSA